MKPSRTSSSVTQKDVARKLNLTQATVSLALQDNPRITEERRREIQAVAKKMGYQPNTAGTSLAHHRHISTVKPVQAALAWLNQWPEPEKLRGYKLFESYWQGAFRSAKKFGFRLDEFCVNEKMPLSQIEKVLLARGLNGILIPSHGGVTANWSGMDWSRFSVVRISLTVEMNFHAVIPDGGANGILAFEKMREKGYKRIAWVGDPIIRHYTHGGGLLWAENEMPPQDRLQPFFIPRGDCTPYQRPFAAWLKKTKPDAIFTDKAELPGMLEKIGCRVPEDMGLAATNVFDCPISAGIDPNPEEIGRVAVLVLVSLIHDNDRGLPQIPRQISIPGKWVDGPSLPQR